MKRLSLGQLHRLSGKAIAAMPAPAAIKVDGLTVALLIPIKSDDAAPTATSNEPTEGLAAKSVADDNN